ncbi:hypothetical protein D3C78_1745170 [compost metagenome]
MIDVEDVAHELEEIISLEMGPIVKSCQLKGNPHVTKATMAHLQNEFRRLLQENIRDRN